MFVRVKSTPNSPRKSVQIVESKRKNGKVTQKIVRYVGIAMDEKEEKQLRDMAVGIIAKLERERIENSAQQSLFDTPSEQEIVNNIKKRAGRPKRKNIEDILPTNQVTLDDIIEKDRVIEGIHEVAGKIYDDIYESLPLGKGTKRILKNTVLSRLAQPSSKHKLQKILLNKFNINHSLDSIYRMMDKVYDNIDNIKRITFNTTQNLFPEGVDVLLFDVTTLYFESIATDDLRAYGYSKDHRFNTTQVVLALATNKAGLPVGYELFPGNKAEVRTLAESIGKWRKLFPIDSVCFVGDRAMMSKENIKLLKDNDYQYVIAAKLKGMTKNLQSKILDEDNYNPQILNGSLGWIGEFAHDNGRLIVSYKSKRAKKDQQDRQRILDKLDKQLGKNGGTKKLVTNSGAKQFVKMENSNAEVDLNKVEKAQQWDGLHGIITNIQEEKAEKLLARYSNLWRIEESFRINKHTLKMRPIFHFKPERIQAHIAICYMTFATLRNLQYQVNLRQKVSVEEIIDELLNVQSSIHMHKKTRDLYKLPGKFTNTAKKIYKAVDLERSLDAQIYWR